MDRTHRWSLPMVALGLLLLPALALAQDSQPAKPKGGGAGKPPAKAKTEAQKLHDAVVKALSEGAIKLECKLQATMTRPDGESDSRAASAALEWAPEGMFCSFSADEGEGRTQRTVLRCDGKQFSGERVFGEGTLRTSGPKELAKDWRARAANMLFMLGVAYFADEGGRHLGSDSKPESLMQLTELELAEDTKNAEGQVTHRNLKFKVADPNNEQMRIDVTLKVDAKTHLPVERSLSMERGERSMGFVETWTVKPGQPDVAQFKIEVQPQTLEPQKEE